MFVWTVQALENKGSFGGKELPPTFLNTPACFLAAEKSVCQSVAACATENPRAPGKKRIKVCIAIYQATLRQRSGPHPEKQGPFPRFEAGILDQLYRSFQCADCDYRCNGAAILC